MRERDSILVEFVDKSDRFATTLVDHGTFGFLPGVPSAYTQPLYGWFLAGIYLPFGRSWLAVGIAQVVVAVATALVVFEIGTRLRSVGVGLVAALITTLHPYVVWHDIHLNREMLDGFMLAATRARSPRRVRATLAPLGCRDRRDRRAGDPGQRPARAPSRSPSPCTSRGARRSATRSRPPRSSSA